MIKTDYEFDFEDTVGVFGFWWTDEILKEYAKKFDLLDDFGEPSFSIIEGDDKFKEDCVEAVKKSLENGRPFFYNAPDYIQKRMIEERENIEKGVCY